MMRAVHFSVARWFVILFLSMSVVGLAGCDDPNQPKQEESDSPSTTPSRYAYGTPPGDSLTPETVDIGQIGEDSIPKAVGTASTWQEAHQRVRDSLSSPSSVPQFVREQGAALEMFRQYLNTDRWRANLTKEKVEALEFYTELLVKNRSPESEFVYVGLRELDGQWSDQRIIDAAETTIQAAEQNYTLPDKPEGTPDEAPETKPARVLEANQKLQHMIDRKRASS